MMDPDVYISSDNIMNPELLNHIAEKGLKGIITEEYSREQNIAIRSKVSHLLGYLTTITTWDSLSQLMQEFNARTYFQEVNFDSFIEKFEQRFGQDIKAYMDEWYTTHEVPLLSIKDASRKTTEDTQIIEFKVGNLSKTDGIVSIVAMSYPEKSVIRNLQSYLIEAGEYKRIVVHEDIKYKVQLTTNFSGHFPENIYFEANQAPSFGPIPKEGVTLLDRNQFYPPEEIIVDNEDDNFSLIDSANNRKRLTDIIKKGDEQKYTNRLQILKTNTWNLPILQELHGKHIRSAFVKKAGTGQFKAEWRANLPEAGKYEIFVYRPHLVGFEEGKTASDHPGMKNYYTVYTPKGKEEIILEIPEKEDIWIGGTSTLPEEEAWVSLGTFTLPAGESRVVLDDRGVPPITDRLFGEFDQMVVADAVKWVKKKY